MKRKELGKITSLRVGIGGYQDAMFGVWLQLGGRSWGVADGRGTWATRSDGAKFSMTEWRSEFADTMLWLADLCTSAGVQDAQALVGKPVEITFDGMKLDSWRILDEVL
jgi:hypothetical protein